MEVTLDYAETRSAASFAALDEAGMQELGLL